MNNKELLFDHLVGFQRKIAKLDKTINDQAEEFTLRQKELFGDLFTILDAYEHLEKNLESKNDTVEKSTRLIIKSTLKIKRKLLRILKRSRHRTLKLSRQPGPHGTLQSYRHRKS